MVRALPPRDPHKWDLLVFAGFLVSLLACFAACTQSLRGDEISVPVDRDAFKGGEVESQDDRFPDPGKPGNPGSDNSPGYSYTVEPKDPKVQKSQAEAQRFPRSIMVTGPDCNPCRKMKLENPDLVGPGPTYPVQSLDYSRDDLSDYGISPSIIIQVPTFVILEAPGTLHKLPTGAVCKHVGGKSREKLEEYLTHETHKVSLEPWTEAPMDPEDCRTVCSIQSSSNLFAALEGHLARCAGAPEPVVGSLFDINFEGPEGLSDILAEFISSRTFKRGGLTLTMPPDSVISTASVVEGMVVSLSKPIQVNLKKSGFNVDAHLYSISISASGTRFELELRKTPGAWIEVPDITIAIQ